MVRRNDIKRVKSYRSICNGATIYGTAKQIADKYLELAREHEINKDEVNKELCQQHAEHYKKLP